MESIADSFSLGQSLNYWFLQTLAMLVTAALIPRLKVTSLFGASAAVGALALLNATIWDTSLFGKLPDSFSMHALTLFVANGTLFFVLVKILPGIEVKGFLPAFIAPLVFTASSLLINQYGKDINWVDGGKKVMQVVTSVRNSLQQAEEKQGQEIKPSSTE